MDRGAGHIVRRAPLSPLSLVVPPFVRPAGGAVESSQDALRPDPSPKPRRAGRVKSAAQRAAGAQPRAACSSQASMASTHLLTRPARRGIRAREAHRAPRLNPITKCARGGAACSKCRTPRPTPRTTASPRPSGFAVVSKTAPSLMPTSTMPAILYATQGPARSRDRAGSVPECGGNIGPRPTHAAEIAAAIRDFLLRRFRKSGARGQVDLNAPTASPRAKYARRRLRRRRRGPGSSAPQSRRARGLRSP
jgi:hypothetical protein